MSKDRLKIEVRTVQNGYTMTVGEKEYMYFTPEQLVAGVFTHIAIGELKYMDSEMVEQLMQAAATWNTVGDALKANAVLMANARSATAQCNIAERARAKAEERQDDAVREARQLRAEITHLKLELETANKKLLGIGKKLVGVKKSSEPIIVQPDDKSTAKGGNLTKFDAQPRAVKQAMIAKPKQYNAKVEYTELQYKALITPIAELPIVGAMGMRVKNALAKVGGRSHRLVADAIIEPRGQLMAMRGVGQAVIKAIDEWLELHGLEWGMDAQSILYHHSLKEVKK